MLTRRNLHLTYWPIVFLLGTTLFMMGCSAPQQKTQLTGADVNPQPLNPQKLESQLARYRGQTDFANLEMDYYHQYKETDDSAPEAGGQSAGSGKREIAESDIFKIGASGSKLLYLLNNYRGLQVISFASGITQPQVIGRVEASGNYPERMYFDEPNMRLVVLERSEKSNYSGYPPRYHNMSRLLAYDVSDPQHPKVSQIIDFEGYLADSRMVGKILYIATSLQSYWSPYQEPDKNQPKGKVYSFSIEGTVQQIDALSLSLPIRFDSMNIVEVKEADIFKYYLLATARQGNWWWSGHSVIEVVDISEPNGLIKPLMSVATKGFVQERSQTHIKDNTLIVTSNYRLEENNWQSPQRIAVETFIMPDENATVLDEQDYQYRKTTLDRQLAKYSDNLPEHLSLAQRQALIDQEWARLLMDQDTGLKGTFMRIADGTFQGQVFKPIADSLITVGDDQGLSANVQDVRYTDDKLYVFWVPRNQVDPFDLFDISQPRQGVKFLGRLKFNGFIQRAIPLTFENRNFVLSLGWITPIVNNETNRRHPQVMLFEIYQDNNQTFQQKIIQQMTLSDQDVWINFQSSDKFVDVRFSAAGKGTILFQMSSWRTDQSGGKLIGFDLTDPQVFKEGPYLTSNEDWLRRVFNNPEIDSINTFSDRQLSTYETQPVSDFSSDAQAAISILELARDIRGYSVLANQTGAYGVQIVSPRRSYSYWNSSHQPTNHQLDLRLVSQANPDARVEKVLDQIHLSHQGEIEKIYLQAETQTLFILTSEVLNVLDSNENPGHTTVQTFEKNSWLYRVRLQPDAAKLSAQRHATWSEPFSIGNQIDESTDTQEIDAVVSAKMSSPDFYGWRNTKSRFVKMTNGSLFLLDGTNVRQIHPQNTQKISVANLPTVDVSGRQINLLADGFYLTYKKKIEGSLEVLATLADDQELDAPVTFFKNYVMPLSLVNNTLQAKLSNPINVPGRLVAVNDNGSHFLTEDNRTFGFQIKDYNQNTPIATSPEFRPYSHTSNANTNEATKKNYVSLTFTREVNLVSLRMEGIKAHLVDMHDTHGVAFNDFQHFKASYLYLQHNSDSNNSYNYQATATEKEQNLVALQVDDLYRFVSTTQPLFLKLGGYGFIAKIFHAPGIVDEYVAVLSQGNSYQLLTLNPYNVVPSLKTVRTTVLGEPQEDNIFTLNGYSPWWDESFRSQTMQFNLTSRSLHFSRGMGGMKTVQIVN